MAAALRLVVFDLAGTTVKDTGHIADAFIQTLSNHGVQVSADQATSVRGASKRQAIAGLLSGRTDAANRAEAAYFDFQRRVSTAFATHGVEPVDGAERVFVELRSRGVAIALNTGFDRDVTELLVSALGWTKRGLVDVVVCGDDVRQGRPAPYLIFHAMESAGVSGVHEVANVGDTILDLHAGHNAGVRWNIGVLSGAHGRSQLEQAPHTHVIGSVADLLSVLG